MFIGYTCGTAAMPFNANICREEKRKILEDFCILSLMTEEENSRLNELKTEFEMERFVRSMVKKYWD